MTEKPFAELTELGQARRLRPLAEAALDSYDLEWTRLRLISNGWNCVFRVDTPSGPRVIRITRPISGTLERPVHSEVEFAPSSPNAGAQRTGPPSVSSWARCTASRMSGLPRTRSAAGR